MASKTEVKDLLSYLSPGLTVMRDWISSSEKISLPEKEISPIVHRDPSSITYTILIYLVLSVDSSSRGTTSEETTFASG